MEDETSVAITRRMYRLIDEKIVDSSNRYRSKKGYMEDAIERGSKRVLPKCKGNKKLIDFLSYLNEYENMKFVPFEPEINTEVVSNQRKEKKPRVELDGGTGDRLNLIQDSFVISKAEAMRVCLLWDMAEQLETVDSLPRSSIAHVKEAASEIETSARRVQYFFNAEMVMRFVEEREETKKQMMKDTRVSEKVADLYFEKIYKSDAIEKVREERGDEPYDNLESIMIDIQAESRAQ